MKKYSTNNMKRNKTALAVSLSLFAGSATAAPVSAPFVDAGVYTHVVEASGVLADRSSHFISKNGSGDHQFVLTGNDASTYLGLEFRETRNSYYAFDLSAVTETVTAATFRFWAVSSGLLRSNHDLTFQLNSVDNYSASDIMNAPFPGAPASDVALNISILNDLGDGSIYGSRLLTRADMENPGLIPSPLSSTTDCSPERDRSAVCGRWLDIDLTAALADINAETGTFIFGGSVPDFIGVGTEQIMMHTVFDLSAFPDSRPHPELRAPAPQLLLETTVVPVPAAVWLFGSGLIGLVGLARRKKAI